jgi:hypothetical protein
VVSCTCMTLTLLHLPFSHVITVCRMRHVLHEGSNQMSPYYSLSTEEKTWTTRFEPLLDPSQLLVYGGGGLCPRRGHAKDAEGETEEEALP